MYITGKDKLGYINGDLPQPLPTDPGFRRWKTEDSTVKGWLINSMDSALIGNFIRFPTAKSVWDSVATTFFDGTDASQVYDLKRRVARMRQGGGPIEAYYNKLQGLWREIDFRRPNPMRCPEDIERYNTAIQEDRVYMFLDALDDRLDKVRADVLQMQPFPTVEQAYARVRREDMRQTVMLTNSDAVHDSAAMVSRGNRMNVKASQESLLQIAKPGGVQERGRPSLAPHQKIFPEGGCSNCGNSKHTRETCFKLHGYPDWWKELKTRKQAEGKGKASLVTAESQLSLTSHVDPQNMMSKGNHGSALVSSNQADCNHWIIDSGATDHMTFTPDDFVHTSEPRRDSISNANGYTYPVTGAGVVAISPAFSLPNTLLVPSLSTKLISVGQVTEDLNCAVIMYPRFCLFQDILTKEIIGRGTKRGGLYFMDDFSFGSASHARGTSISKEKQIWLWHRRLGHPSFGYLKRLFPELFSNVKDLELQCQTCILAKSHRVPFPISLNKSEVPFR